MELQPSTKEAGAQPDKKYLHFDNAPCQTNKQKLLGYLHLQKVLPS